MISFTRDDIEFILQNSEPEFELKSKLNLTMQDANIAFATDELLELDELCKNKLQTSGFDKDYALTPIGKKLELLIDKIHFMIESDKDGKGHLRFGR